MKKFLLLQVVAILFCHLSVLAQDAELKFTTSFPKGTVLKLCIEGSDITLDGLSGEWLPYDDTEYTVEKKDITIKGNITRFRCVEAGITKFDLSKAHTLEMLSCPGNSLTALDASGCSKITDLFCNDNNLKSLNVKECPELKVLYCYENKIEELDVSNNPKLEILSCTVNKIHSVDLKNNTALQEIYFAENGLSEIDLTNNTALKTIWLNDNNLSSIDLSTLVNLKSLYIHRNNISSLDFSVSPKLYKVYCCLNDIKGEAMTTLVTSLPIRKSSGQIVVIDYGNEKEKNVCLKKDIDIAAEKNWVVYNYNNNDKIEFEGSDVAGIEDIEADNMFSLCEDGIMTYEPVMLNVFTFDGKCVYAGTKNGKLTLERGSYIVRVNNKDSFKCVIK